jgi:hypothetical protein
MFGGKLIAFTATAPELQNAGLGDDDNETSIRVAFFGAIFSVADYTRLALAHPENRKVQLFNGEHRLRAILPEALRKELSDVIKAQVSVVRPVMRQKLLEQEENRKKSLVQYEKYKAQQKERERIQHEGGPSGAATEPRPKARLQPTSKAPSIPMTPPPTTTTTTSSRSLEPRWGGYTQSEWDAWNRQRAQQREWDAWREQESHQRPRAWENRSTWSDWDAQSDSSHPQGSGRSSWNRRY